MQKDYMPQNIRVVDKISEVNISLWVHFSSPITGMRSLLRLDSVLRVEDRVWDLEIVPWCSGSDGKGSLLCLGCRSSSDFSAQEMALS